MSDDVKPLFPLPVKKVESSFLLLLVFRRTLGIIFVKTSALPNIFKRACHPLDDKPFSAGENHLS